ncbi:HalOD1 output domain-containing protein [Natrialba swarupiae]|uniref:Halobacterial output domain-containing protein n=1 Tax=Natrialba swarupiae TaxID=2448032 RepID=A0A5D5ALM4_9EURY|nr:HalOD1 output domain-containing protein [Natrialba swarupiae]TYT61747.1 hypothetical protein FYC77_12020 [Natrialba swarupiae]
MGDSNETIEVNLQDENIDSKPSIVIAKALATFEGVDPETLPTACGIRLHDYVDPDALDKLVSSDEDVSILFNIEDYRVKVGDSKLKVEETYHS